ncbi:hypothetical protein ATCC90586_000880 [Pythium insidiosum]|nr:hypothetical protein ATCC90586_000880 [Pythium insidiosum]
MDALALSPRAPRWERAPRSSRPSSRAPSAACVDVQWRFLASSSSPSEPSGRGSSTVDQLTRHPSVRVELEQEHQRLRLDKERRERQEHRVLQDLLGTTQRKALLDKVLHEMEVMALTPVRHEPRNKSSKASPTREPLAESRRSSALHSLLKRGSLLTAAIEQSSHHTGGRRTSENVELLPQRRLSALGNAESHDDDSSTSATTAALPATGDANDSGNDDSSSDCDDLPELRFIRDRHRRLTQSAMADADDSAGGDRTVVTPRILWQKTTHVRLAADLPDALLNEWDEDQEVETAEKHAADAAGAMVVLRRRHHRRSSSPARLKSSAASSPTKGSASPRVTRRAAYGSWYVPRDQWWTHHESERQRLAAAFPEDLVLPIPHAHDEPHCHHAAIRNHKDPLPQMPRPPAAAVGPVANNAAGLPSRPTSPSSRPLERGLDPMANRAAALHQEIPQSYIGREYRNYLVSRGARLPTYLT